MSCVLLISKDLLFGSRMSGIAAARQIDLVTAQASDDVLAHCAACRPTLVLVDLATAEDSWPNLIPKLRGAGAKWIVAYGPHVHKRKLAIAEDSGCDQVLTRGAFHAQMDELLQRATAP